ncbi:MAG: tetratricopeptide repeat protein [Akkermansiaceae bacterium]
MWRQVVAQSPGANAADGEVLRYDVGWKALNTMLKAGRSLSGHERNCAFLNTGGSRFADVSQATGLDFDDDGRAVATVDWDQDGDLDFWIANRTAPLVRFLRNNTDYANHFVQFLLRGTTCNRDAIGARLEIKLKGKTRPRIQTVKSGGGYLSHSSRWLHFGLGKDGAEIESLTVVWPNGVREVLPSVDLDQRYHLTEGEKKAVAVPAKKRIIAIKPGVLDPPVVTDQARVVLLQPLPIPAMNYQAADGSVKPVISADGKPRLVTLWASWCPCCMGELTEWKSQDEVFRSSNLEVVTINIEPANAWEKAGEVFKENAFPFTLGFGAETMGEQFDVIQRAVLSQQRPLPLPSSFLIDGKGQLCVIYKGPVAPEQVAKDAQLIGAPLDRILAASSPFPGKWLGIPSGSSPNSLAIRFVEGGFTSEAEAYLKRLTTEGAENPTFSAGNAFVLLGAIYQDQKRFEDAAVAFGKALEIDPDHRQSAIELAGVLVQLGRPAEAVPYYLKALERRQDDPELHFKLALAYLNSGKLASGMASLNSSLQLRPSPLAHYNLGNALLGTGKIQEAMAQYAAAVVLEPNLIPAANNLAWLLSTQPDDTVRDGKRAVELAEKICAVPASRTSSHLDTLGVAFAEAGRFFDAIKTVEEAISLSKQPAEIDDLKKRLALYQANKPYRD